MLSLVGLGVLAAACSSSGDGDGKSDASVKEAGPLVTVDGGTFDAGPSPTDAPPPVLTALAPASVSAGATDTVVTLTGTGFVARSSVEVNGAVVSSTLVDDQHLQLVFSAATLANGAVLHVIVATDAPGGGV